MQGSRNPEAKKLTNDAYLALRRNKPAPCLTRGRKRETQQMGVFQQPDRVNFGLLIVLSSRQDKGLNIRN
jgi:hypothetical protein